VTALLAFGIPALLAATAFTIEHVRMRRRASAFTDAELDAHREAWRQEMTP